MTWSDEGLVTLRGGRVASLAALRILWGLQSRGFIIEPAGDKLRVHPARALTPDELAEVRAHRNDLLALVDYCEGVQ